MFGSCCRAARFGGKSSSSFGATEGSWWSSEVRRCELRMVTGSSTRMSWYRRPLFWRLRLLDVL